MLVTQCPTLCNPMDCCPPGSSVQGILQARILEWVAMPSPRGSSWIKDWTYISYTSCAGRQVLYHYRHLVLITELAGRALVLAITDTMLCDSKYLPLWTSVQWGDWVWMCLNPLLKVMWQEKSVNPDISPACLLDPHRKLLAPSVPTSATTETFSRVRSLQGGISQLCQDCSDPSFQNLQYVHVAFFSTHTLPIS